MQKALIVILILILAGVATSSYLISKRDADSGNEAAYCTLEAKLCPNGSYVGRVPPSCDFAPCPVTATDTVSESGAAAKAAIVTKLTASTTVALPESLAVTYTSGGFYPREAIVAKGGTVTFVNRSGSNMWVASDPHPTHNGYPGFDELRSVPPGGSWSFAFDREGSWGYHNHIIPTHNATIIVQ